MRSELIMGHVNGFWLLNWACIVSPPNLYPGLWQLIRSNLLSLTIAGDESWIYCYDHETMQQSSLWQSSNSLKPKKSRQVSSKIKSIIIILTSSGLLKKKNSSSQAKQIIPHTTVTYCGHYVKICEDFAPKFGDKRTGCCITTLCPTFTFLPRNFLPKHDCPSPLALLFCFPI
jgi:hypothetical protein